MTALAPLFPFARLLAWSIVAGPMNLFTLFLKLRERQLESQLRAELVVEAQSQGARA